MVMSSGAFKDATNGRQRTTDGIRKHTGPWYQSGDWTLQAGGLFLPPGSIKTADIAAGATQQLLGQYFGTPTWSTTATAVWIQTPMSVALTPVASGLIRIEFITVLAHSVANASYYYGIAFDGANPTCYWYDSQGAAGVQQAVSGTFYYTLSLAAHTVYFVVYNVTAGTLQQVAVGFHTMYVTEQKR